MDRNRVFAFLLLATVVGYWIVQAGSLEPPGPPAPTMVTLQEIYDAVKLPSDTCFDNVGRFVVCGDGAVKDNLTGLFWLEDANCFGQNTWADANIAGAQLGDGQCGLTDGSSPGDWRLPTKEEWEAIVVQAVTNGCAAPYFPDVRGLGCCGTGTCAFAGVQSGIYWSSATYVQNPSIAWLAGLGTSLIGSTDKTSNFYVWPVRDGQ